MLVDKQNMYNIFVDNVQVGILNATEQYAPFSLPFASLRLSASNHSQTQYQVACDLPPGQHTLTLTKRTEAFFGVCAFYGVFLDGGRQALLSAPVHPIATVSIMC